MIEARGRIGSEYCAQPLTRSTDNSPGSIFLHWCPCSSNWTVDLLHSALRHVAISLCEAFVLQRRNVRCWLQADIKSLEFEVCSTPKSGHSEAHDGLLLVTQSGHLGVRSANQPEPKISSSRISQRGLFFFASLLRLLPETGWQT